MSNRVSTTISFEEHFGPKVPDVAVSPEQLTMVPRSSGEGSRLGELVEQMRRSVVSATESTDRAAKSQLWDEYRMARTEALAMLAPPLENRRLRSV